MSIAELFNHFNTKSGDLGEYSEGNVPFVSNSNLNNGVVAYVDSLADEVVKDIPCLAVNGFGFATIQTEPFIGAGNGGVHVIALVPKERMSIMELAFYASQINHASWRFSYGRRAIWRRLNQVTLERFNLLESEVSKIESDFVLKARGAMRSIIR